MVTPNTNRPNIGSASFMIASELRASPVIP